MKRFNKKSLLSLLLVLVMLFSQSIVFADVKLPTRAEAEDKYKWDLTEIYKTRSDFEADMKKFSNELIPKYEKYKGKLNTADNLLEYFKLDEEASKILMKGYVYSKLSLDLNQADSNAQEMFCIA